MPNRPPSERAPPAWTPGARGQDEAAQHGRPRLLRSAPLLARMFEKRRRGYRTIGYAEADINVPAAYDDVVVAARDPALARDEDDG
jgi:hypothetical protein